MEDSESLAAEKCNQARKEIDAILKKHGVSLNMYLNGNICITDYYKHEDGKTKIIHSRPLCNTPF